MQYFVPDVSKKVIHDDNTILYMNYSNAAFISNNEWASEILVSLAIITLPSRKLHSQSIVLRKEMVSDLHAVRVHV